MEICAECDQHPCTYCTRCNATFCDEHIKTHLKTKICQECKREICLEMFENEKHCFHCWVKLQCYDIRTMLSTI